jgi:hypothetical protein
VYQGFLLEVKATDPTNLPPSCDDCLEFWKPQPPETIRACPGLYRESLMICVLNERRGRNYSLEFLEIMWNEIINVNIEQLHRVNKNYSNCIMS